MLRIEPSLRSSSTERIVPAVAETSRTALISASFGGKLGDLGTVAFEMIHAAGLCTPICALASLRRVTSLLCSVLLASVSRSIARKSTSEVFAWATCDLSRSTSCRSWVSFAVATTSAFRFEAVIFATSTSIRARNSFS